VVRRIRMMKPLVSLIRFSARGCTVDHEVTCQIDWRSATAKLRQLGSGEPASRSALLKAAASLLDSALPETNLETEYRRSLSSLAQGRIAWRGCRSGSARRRPAARIFTSPAANELHIRRVNLECVARLAVAVSPLLHAQAAFDVDGSLPRVRY